MPAKPKIVLATHNEHKREEFQTLLPELELISAKSLNLPEPDETGTTFHANALIKAEAAATKANLPALADDSGIACLGLNGAPGIYSARWAGPGGDFAHAMQRIRDELTAKYSTFEAADRRAQFIASLCLAFPDGAHTFFDGITDGEVLSTPKGTNGFGYDPIFLPQGQTQTFGEMTPAAKHALSHRARAVTLLQDWLATPSTLQQRLFS